jgi:hypothetical protein
MKKRILYSCGIRLLLCFSFIATFIQVSAQSNSANYSFTTTTTGSLTDMSSGTTQLNAADQDDVSSFVTNIGFDFFFMGVRYSQFSVNSNGTLRFGATVISNTLYDPLGQAAQNLITAYGADQRTHAGNGKVHYKMLGTAPNRVLVVEWLNMQSDFNAGGTADLTYQLRLSETTGEIEFVYGSMTMGANGAADPNSQSPQMGFSSNNAVGTVGSVTAAQSSTPAPSFSGASGTPVNNLYGTGTIPVLTSVSDGSRRIFKFTPPAVTAPEAPLAFTSITTTGMTLNWTDSPNEVGYVIYRSDDGGNTYNYINSVAQNATSSTQTGLFENSTYYWKVYALSEGNVNFINGSQITPAAGSITAIASGLWSAPSTWSSGVVPTSNDNVTIQSGNTVTIDVAANAYKLTIPSGGILQFEQTTARTLIVYTDVTINAGGVFQSNLAGTQTGHNLQVGGNLINNGTLDFSTNADVAGAIITFTGTNNNTFSGIGTTTDIRQITMNKGTSSLYVLEITVSNLTVRGVTTDTVVGGFLVMANGTLKISGSFSMTSRVFAAAGYTIPVTAGFWLNNPNFTVAGQNGNPTNSGLLRISQGTFNVGTATGNSMGFSTGSTVIAEGGVVKVTGRFGVAAAGNSITYTQSGGTITVCTIGNPSATLGAFDLGTSTNSTINISGGTVICQLASTAIDYRCQSGAGITAVTGGTLQLGNASSGAAKTFNLRGIVPNVVVTNISANHTATMSTTLVNFNNTSLDITTNPGATFNIGNTTHLFTGTTLTNNGTFTANGANSNLAFVGNGNLYSSSQTLTGAGVFTTPMTNLTIQTSDVYLTTTNQITVNRLNLIKGNVHQASKLTLGNGGATTAVVQIGGVASNNAGSLDVALTFNPGTGGVNLLYTTAMNSITTGFEVPPSRVLNLLSVTNSNDITIAGGDITVNGTAAGAITLNGGRVITGANTLYFNSSAGTVSHSTGYVDGNFKKSFAAAASQVFEVGTANGYSPVTANVTAGTFPADVAIKAVQSTQPNLNPTNSLQRYWTLTSTGGVTTDLTFNYQDADVMGNESLYSLVNVSGGVPSITNGTVNTGANTATAIAVSSPSGDWALAEGCTGAVGGTASGSTSFCASGTPIITATGYSKNVGSSYQWQSSSDNFVSDTVNIMSANNPAVLNAGTVSSTMYYRLKVKCSLATDSAYSNIISVKIKQPTVSSVNISGCDSVKVNGIKYITSGTYIQTMSNAAGCDSVITIHAVVNYSSTGDTTSIACNSFTWYGTTYSFSGDKIHTLSTINGCDSIVTLHLTINNSTTSSTTITACDSYTWNGTTYTSSGTKTFSTTNSKGCDSTATLYLTINNGTTSSATITACDSYTWNGTTYTNSGTKTFSTTNSKGCDSTATLYLTINNGNTSSTTIIACDSYTWNGITYTSSGTKTFSTTNSKGCDSTATLYLTINNSTSSSTTITSCDSYTWNGTTYTSSGTKTFNTTNSKGCDSTATLYLTISNSTTSSTTITSCDSYTWNGTTYASSGTKTFTTTNSKGCDSIATLHLTINNINLTVTANSNILTADDATATYQWIDCNNNDLPINGEINQSFTAIRNGSYAVVVTKGACMDTSVVQSVTLTGINQATNSIGIVVYPNPTSDAVNVHFGERYAVVTLMEVSGKELETISAMNSVKFNLSELTLGVYVIKVQAGEQSTVYRVVRQ